MDGANLEAMLEQLENNLDNVEETLHPLLQTKLSNISKSLPLLDKAKLHVLITYIIESLLFSYLRLHGVNAKDHPVFTELTRVKQYFAKISEADAPQTKRENLSLDKQAAGRFIKHALAGNERYDLERAEREAREKASAQLKLQRLDKKRSASEAGDDAESTGWTPHIPGSSNALDASSTNAVSGPARQQSDTQTPRGHRKKHKKHPKSKSSG